MKDSPPQNNALCDLLRNGIWQLPSMPWLIHYIPHDDIKSKYVSITCVLFIPLLVLYQTPSMYHCLQNRSGYDGDKFVRQSKLMILGSDYVARPGLLKPKHQISFVVVLIIKKLSMFVAKYCSGCTLAILQLCVWVSPFTTHEWTMAVLIRLNFTGDNVMWSTVVCWTVTHILVSPVYIIATSQFSNHGLQTMLKWPRHQSCCLCLYLKISK